MEKEERRGAERRGREKKAERGREMGGDRREKEERRGREEKAEREKGGGRKEKGGARERKVKRRREMRIATVALIQSPSVGRLNGLCFGCSSRPDENPGGQQP